jgi:predicted lipase
MIVMTPLKATGVTNVGDAYVHTGFQYAYSVVGKTVLDAVKAQVAAYPSYNIVVTGHSLGGSVASFAALALKEAFPNKPIKLFTYGELTSLMPEPPEAHYLFLPKANRERAMPRLLL